MTSTYLYAFNMFVAMRIFRFLFLSQQKALSKILSNYAIILQHFDFFFLLMHCPVRILSSYFIVLLNFSYHKDLCVCKWVAHRDWQRTLLWLPIQVMYFNFNQKQHFPSPRNAGGNFLVKH